MKNAPLLFKIKHKSVPAKKSTYATMAKPEWL
jgi:hypothetical protein